MLQFQSKDYFTYSVQAGKKQVLQTSNFLKARYFSVCKRSIYLPCLLILNCWVFSISTVRIEANTENVVSKNSLFINSPKYKIKQPMSVPQNQKIQGALKFIYAKYKWLLMFELSFPLLPF